MIVMTDNITTAKASPKKSQNVETTEPSENDTSVEAWSLALEGIVTEVAPEHIPNPPVAMLDWLYLAPMYCVRHKADELAAMGITHVLSTNRMPPTILEEIHWELRSRDIDHCYIPAEDILSYDMMKHWPEARQFLQACGRPETCTVEGDRPFKALVHCSAGMNRSGTMVAAAMMEFGQMTLLEVGRELKQKRGYALSNSSFRKQLVKFAMENGHLGGDALPEMSTCSPSTV